MLLNPLAILKLKVALMGHGGEMSPLVITLILAMIANSRNTRPYIGIPNILQ